MWDEQDWESAGQYVFRQDWGESDLNSGRNDEWTFDKVQLEDLESELKRPFMRPNAEKTGSFPSIFGPVAATTYQEHLEREVNLSCCSDRADWLSDRLVFGGHAAPGRSGASHKPHRSVDLRRLRAL